MAVSATSSPVDFPGGLRITKGTLTFDASYPTGGEDVSAAQFGASSVGCDGRKPDFVAFQNVSPSTTTNLCSYIRATGKVTAHGTAAGTFGVLGAPETTAASDLSTRVVDFIAFWVNPGATVTTA